MLSLAIMLASLAAGVVVVRAHRKRVERSWKQLAAAVPDTPDEALGPTPYRDARPEGSALVPHSRKALELLPSTRRRMWLQQSVAGILPPAMAALWAAIPFEALGPWSAVIGAVWGLGTSVALLRDDRKALGLFAFMLAPLTMAIIVTFIGVPAAASGVLWSVVGSVGAYGAARLTLDQKDAASKDEAHRERLADPRYLLGSTEGRAAGIVTGRGGEGEGITDASARSSTTVT